MFTVCGCIAGILLLATGGVFLYLLISKYTHRRLLTPLYCLFIGCFAAVFVLMLPVIDLSDMSASMGAWLRGGARLILALHNTLQVFTIDVGAQDLLAAIQAQLPGFSIYFLMMSVLMIVCPVLTLSFILSLVKNLSAYIRLCCSFGKDWYVFSELNEKSIALAQDIRKNHSNAAVVFTDVFGGEEEASYELIEKAKEISAICFKRDIVTINFRPHSKNAQTILFTIGENETENVDQALKLIEMYKARVNVRIFVFSTRVDGEILLTKAEKGNVKVRRVNEVRSLVNRQLYHSGNKLFENAKEIGGGQKKISAVILGLGQHGTEMLKALTWYCQMDGYQIEIDAFDLDALAQDRFAALAPELMSEDYNGVIVPEEAEYTIRIHAGVDVNTKSFADCLSGLRDTTYTFISLGSDEANIRTAVNMRMLFERMKIHPTIQAIVCNPDAKAALTGITNYRGQAYDIDFIGDTADSYSEDVILNSALEADALRRHLKWGEEKEFWQYEYNYNSSVASAIHARARIAQGIPGAEKKEEDLTDTEKTTIQKLEHRRWNAYMRAEGYVYSGSPDKKSRNDLAKMHHDLVDFSSLSEEEKRKDTRVGNV